MRLRLDLDLDALGDDAPKEAARILRYWAGAVGQMDLGTAVEHPLMDSAYTQVGSLALVDADGEDEVKRRLRYYLTHLHEDLLWKIDGLGERDARWPMTPTGTNLLGLLKHVASIEAGYLGEVVGRPFPEPMPWIEDGAEVNADMYAAPDETIGSIRAFAERVWAHADTTIDALPLDAPAEVPWWGEKGHTTFGHILVHVIDDVARHAGHADVVREMIDGAAGLTQRNSNLPDGDAQWWADYVERLKKIASDAG